MRIGLDARFWDLKNAGLGRYTQELVKNLLKLDHKNEYFLLLNPKDAESFDLEADNLQVVKIDSPHYSVMEQVRMPFEIARLKLDFVHFLSFNHPILWPGKFLVSIHDLTLYLYPARSRKSILHRWAMSVVVADAAGRANHIFALSENTKKDIVKKFSINPDKITITYLGVPSNLKMLPKSRVQAFIKKKKIATPFLFYVGQWRAHKNLIRLVRAFELAKKTAKTDFKLVIGGKPDPDYSQLLIAIAKSPVKKDIIIPGFISDEELPYWYNAATAFIFPSLYEGFGLPVLEAAKCGTPVLSSNSSSLPEVLGEAALYFDPKSIKQMAKLMNKIVDDPKLREELKAKGLKKAEEFSYQNVAKKILNVYNKIK
ncbi:MAG TPA: glycosyltransferase family 1 protein [Patescibacteria group bacterium]|nr:glycosyltransferase family 1 protein [Patescibacteria group bacterium]